MSLALAPWQPFGLPVKAAIAAGLATWMACWWLTECVPIAVTSLLPMVVLPACAILDTDQAARGYAHKVNILLMCGFMLAKAIEKWQLHRRIALNVVAVSGARVDGLLLAFMAATALASMWISNTATTLMMLPIALACVGQATDPSSPERRAMGAAFVLGIAYSASIGGLGTPIGTPPNLICQAQYELLAARLAKEGRVLEPLTFNGWMALGVPVVVLFIPASWWILRQRFKLAGIRLGDNALIREQIAKLGAMSLGERRVALLFGTTAILWMSRGDLTFGQWSIPGWERLFPDPKFIDDAGVAAFMVIVMGIVPVDPESEDPRRHRVLDWETASKIPWEMILLFGGGISLAAGFQASGLSGWLGQRLDILAGWPAWAMVLSLAIGVTFLTEITSNTAVTTLLMPILALTASRTGIEPKLLMIPAAMSASCAFMFPVATAPNAIAFGTGEVSMAEMARTGLWLNLAGVVIISGLCLLLL